MVKHISEAADEIIEYIKGKRDGTIRELKTRWDKINKNAPVEWNSLYIIAGVSGSGKSSFANELETSLFDFNPQEDFCVLSFNYEMTAARQVGRKLSFKTLQTVSELYSKNDNTLSEDGYNRAIAAANSVKKYNIYYQDQPATVAEMRDLIVQMYKKVNKPMVIFIDHARLVKKSGKNEQEMMIELTQMCIELKKELKITIFILSQLNREIEKAERIQNPQGHFPMRSDLFASDALYQGADVVMVIHRPELFSIQRYGIEALPVEDMVYIHVLKNRDGEPKILSFKNVLKFNRLDELKI